MSLPLRLFHDADGHARAAWEGHDPKGRWLAQFLEGDVGASVSQCDHYLAAARSAGGKDHTRTGNAFTVVVGPRETVLRALHGAERDQTFAIPTADFVHLLERWRALLEEEV